MAEIETTYEEKPYVLKHLKAPDTFLMIEIIKKLGLTEIIDSIKNDEIKATIAEALSADDKVNLESLFAKVGFSFVADMVQILLGNMGTIQNDLYKLLSHGSNLTEAEVEDLNFLDFTNMITDFIGQDDFRNFIQVVSKLFS